MIPALSVVIVNYESGDHLRTCLESLEAAGEGIGLEIVVVDNASKDDSLAGVDDMAGITVIHNSQNRGFGRACNQGAAATSAGLICFLNPDTVPAKGSLTELVSAIERDEKIGAVGPRMINADGSLYPSCRVHPSLRVAAGHVVFGLVAPNNRFSRSYKMLDWDHATDREVDWLSGAALLVRREAFVAVRGFDEGFFMYVEDLDLCTRLISAGYRIVYHPAAEMVHHVAGSSRRTPYKMVRHHHLSLIRYAWNRGKNGPKIVLMPAVAVLAMLRMLMAWGGIFLRKRLGTS